MVCELDSPVEARVCKYPGTQTIAPKYPVHGIEEQSKWPDLAGPGSDSNDPDDDARRRSFFIEAPPGSSVRTFYFVLGKDCFLTGGKVFLVCAAR